MQRGREGAGDAPLLGIIIIISWNKTSDVYVTSIEFCLGIFLVGFINSSAARSGWNSLVIRPCKDAKAGFSLCVFSIVIRGGLI